MQQRKPNPYTKGALCGSAVLRVAAPDACAERFADSKAHPNRNANNQHTDQDLNQDAVSFAEFGEAVAAVTVSLGVFGLSLPVVLAGPDLAVGSSLGALCRFSWVRFGIGDDSLNVGVERVLVCTGWCR